MLKCLVFLIRLKVYIVHVFKLCVFASSVLFKPVKFLELREAFGGISCMASQQQV